MVVKRRLEVCRVLLAWSVLAALLSPAVSANTVTVNSSSQSLAEIQSFTGGPQILIFSMPGTVTGTSLVSISPLYAIRFDGAMVFDLSFIPRGTTINSASFTMSVGGSQGIGGIPSLVVLDYVASSRTVSSGDFMNPPPLSNLVGTIGNLPLNASIGSIDVVQPFDVSVFIRSLVNNGTPYAGFYFQDGTSGHDGGTEYIPGSTVPSLTITSPVTLVVPEPRSALMLALGMAGVLLVALVARPHGLTRQSAVGRTRR